MNNFTHSIPTTVFFGKGQVENLPAAIKQYGKKVLMVYGGGSIKKMGLYDKVVSLFKENGIEWVELSGVNPNPRVTSVNEGVRLCRENGVEAVLAVGGGSTIDCSKVIAASVDYPGDAWDIVTGKAQITKVLPVFSILTLAATGSEMDPMAVISNMETNDKEGIGHPDMRPKASVLDPTYTFSVSKKQTAAGTADIMSHIFEVYFSRVKDGFLQDRMAEALLKTCIKYGLIAVNEPDNYEARANLMWASSWAINGLLTEGKEVAWTVHGIEHELSAYYDITHGVGLAILTPVWMEYVLSDETVDKFAEFGVNVWDIDKNQDKYDIAHQAIDKTRDYFKQMGIPSKLSELGIGEENFEIMAEKSTRGLENAYVPLTKEDIVKIYKACL